MALWWNTQVYLYLSVAFGRWNQTYLWGCVIQNNVRKRENSEDIFFSILNIK